MSIDARNTTGFNPLSAALADRYRIERELGAGGMATVYLAHDLKHDRKVALKVLKPELAAVLGAERFVVEIKTTASLQHPNILPLFDSGEAGGFLYYVMPFIEGETLRAKLDRETQLGIDEAVNITCEVAGALDYAHRHGVIHRDIKPENILLHDGRAMVMDFGIALAVSAAVGGRMTETGLSLGTPHYMSPEQATADRDITARSDIYSLASVLYEMLAGDPPFVASSAQAVIMKIITEPARPVNEHRRSVPSNLVAAVGKALEKLPADRFESAKAFSDALANPAFETATAAHAKSARTSGVSPVLFRATAAVAVLSLAGLAWSLRRTEGARPVTRLSLAFPDSQQIADGGSFSRLALSPDGRTIAYVGPGGSASSARLWVRRLDQLRATSLAGTDGATNPSFSPDGKRIAFVSGTPWAVRVIPVGGGPPITLTDSGVGRGGLSWGSDGYIYYDGDLAADGLARIRETGGKPETASIPDKSTELFHLNPSALPNGRGVIFTVVRAGGLPRYDVGVLDTRTGKHVVLVHGAVGRYAASGHLVYVTSDGLLMAAPFDADRLRVTGEAVAVAPNVAIRVLSGADVAISHTGTLLYSTGHEAGGDQEMVWVASNGKATAVDSSFTRSFMGRVRLSPDGKQAAISGAGNTGRWVWVKQLDHGPAAKVLEEWTPQSWSPDGKLLLVTRDQARPTGLFVAPSDGSGPPMMLDAGHTMPSFAEFSGDGKWVVYVQGDSIYAVSVVLGTTGRLLVAGPRQRGPTVSPNGRWLAYSSDESGHAEVYIRPFPDTKASKRQVSAAGGVGPRWSHDGRELFFVDESRYMVAVPIASGQTLVIGEPKRLFDASAYNLDRVLFDVAPDGRFLMTRPVGSGGARPKELVLVENFFQELETKVKSR
ncbi:MAG TPA: protein kinase [Gemmatimonadaceae bacterium]|nr:protein kinase [Gemmatimonadaceae bacterium]